MTGYCSFSLAVSPEGSVNIEIDPSKVVYDEGDDLLLTCSALGGPSNTIQWQRNNTILINETESVLNRSDITATGDGGVYSCVVTNDAGSDMDTATVNVSPIITQSPQDIIVSNPQLMEIRNLLCLATGFPEPTFQWFKIGGNLSENVTGETTSTLIFNLVQYGDEGDYYCQVTSNNITINSTIAELASKCSWTVFTCMSIFISCYYSFKSWYCGHQSNQ